jgi:hypothetical protein
MSTPSQPIQAVPNGGAQPVGGQPEPEVTLTPGAEPAGPELTPEPEGGDLQPGDQRPDITEPKEDGRIIPAHIRALKDTKPEEYKRAKTDFFDLRDRRTVHPTVQAAREEHELIQSLGGNEGITQLREDGQFFKQAAQQFLRGDKAFYSDLWEEDQTAAETGLPIMLELAREKSKDVYDAVLSRVWDEEFKLAGWDRQINALAQAIENGEKERAITLVEAFHNWRKGYTSKAQRAEDPRLKRLMAERASEQENKSKTEQETFLNSYKAAALNAVASDTEKMFDSYFKGRKITAPDRSEADEDDRKDLLREILSLAVRKAGEDQEFIRQREQHLKNGDSNAALKLTKSRYAIVLPDAVKRVARRYGMLAGNPKPAPTKENGAGPSGAQPAKPAQGFVNVNERPQRTEINQEATARLAAKEGLTWQDLVVGGRAVLNDGRKVSWAHLKQKVA